MAASYACLGVTRGKMHATKHCGLRLASAPVIDMAGTEVACKSAMSWAGGVPCAEPPCTVWHSSRRSCGKQGLRVSHITAR